MQGVYRWKAPRQRGREASEVIYLPLPWASTEASARPRCQRIAALSGCDVLAVHAPGTGRVIIDRATRRSLKLGDFRKVAAAHAEAVAPLMRNYLGRWALCDSGRSSLGAHLAVTQPNLFTGVTTRDGFKRWPGSALTALRNLRKRSNQRGSAGPPPEGLGARPPIGSQVKGILYGLAEAWNYHEIMCYATTDFPAYDRKDRYPLAEPTVDNLQALYDLAATPTVPFQNVVLGQGISGTVSEVIEVNTALGEVRAAAAAQLPEGVAQPFVATFEPTWGHGVLLDPDGAVKHLRQLNRLLPQNNREAP